MGAFKLLCQYTASWTASWAFTDVLTRALPELQFEILFIFHPSKKISILPEVIYR